MIRAYLCNPDKTIDFENKQELHIYLEQINGYIVDSIEDEEVEKAYLIEIKQ